MPCLTLSPLIDSSIDKFALFTVKDFVSHWFFVDDFSLTLLQLAFKLKHQRNGWLINLHIRLGLHIFLSSRQDSFESCIFFIFLIKVKVVKNFSHSWFSVIVGVFLARGIMRIQVI